MKWEDGYLEHDNWLFHPIEEWSQFFESCNWYTFNPIKFEIENDAALGGFEITSIILGLGFRWRWNYTETEKLAEIKQVIGDIKSGKIKTEDLPPADFTRRHHTYDGETKMVTGEQVRQAAAKANITRIDHHDCGGCGYMTAFLIRDGQLYFDPGCNCSRYGCSCPEPRSWDSAADWINMQSKPEHKINVAKMFGLELDQAR